ncbi:MAG TPA: anthranilate phosphoribosyltransferase [Longimicrobiales bacterium]|nr:anthranilate phosphoribosyltransferase [Longimicrobiales bacterium]
MASVTATQPASIVPGLVAKAVAGGTLTIEEAEAAFAEIMTGSVPPVQIAALLVALRTRGEVAAEIAGGVRAMRQAMLPVRAPADTAIVDTCGTGGGTFTTFNISTAAALVAAGAGVTVTKHGNRSFTSRCGSADVLEALGIPIELSPDGMARVLERAGIVFMFAPLLHPAMRHVGPVRRELGVPTIMNLLGPLTNPAGARRQLVGVSSPHLVPLVGDALAALGHEHALVVHGNPGMDEMSPIGRTEGVEVRAGEVTAFRLDPRTDLGWPEFEREDLAGGDAIHNARIIEDVLAGRGTPGAHAAVVLNAAGAIYLAGLAPSIGEAVATAERSVSSGAAADALSRLRDAAREVAAES